MAAEIRSDGTIDFSGGQDASGEPIAVGPNQYYAGINLSVENQVIQGRWGIDERPLVFPSKYLYRPNKEPVSYEEVFSTGRFQAALPYSISSEYYVLIIVAGYIFNVNQRTYAVDVLNPNDQLDPRSPRINWSPASQYAVNYDFPSYPMLLNGLTARRADPAKEEVPRSNIGAYNQNRLFIGNAGNEFTAGDPTGSRAAPDAPITFKEVIENSSPYVGQIFALSTNYNNDPITCMGFIQFVDTSTGIGPLFVSTKEAIYTYGTQVPRAQWQAGQFGTNICFNAGVVGPRAAVNVNSDLMFLSSDGQVRSLSMARDEQKRWSTTPISREVQNWLKVNDQELLSYSVAGYFKNKVFFSANPYRVLAKNLDGTDVTDVAFGGLVVLELDNLAALGKPPNPVWAGLWTGVRVLDMVTNNKRMFIVGKDGRTNKLYEFTPEKSYDRIGGKRKNYKATVYTKEYYGQSSLTLKKISSFVPVLRDMQGNIEMKVSYKPSHFANFVFWRTFKFVSKVLQCTLPLKFFGLARQTIRDLKLGGVREDVCSPVNGDLANVFRAAQLKIEISGEAWKLYGAQLKFDDIPENEFEVICETDLPKEVVLECNKDWVIEYGD